MYTVYSLYLTLHVIFMSIPAALGLLEYVHKRH